MHFYQKTPSKLGAGTINPKTSRTNNIESLPASRLAGVRRP
jgi:hypothetical protein